MPWAGGSKAGALCVVKAMCVAQLPENRNLVTDEHKCVLCNERVHVHAATWI
jgi:hypothetical protein